MKPAYSMWFWAAITVGAGVLTIVAPHLIATALGAATPLPDSTLALARLLGIVLLGYGAAYGVAAASDGCAYMRFSVLLRASILPALVVMVVIGWFPKLLLALGLLDLVGALWTHLELRQRAVRATVFTNPTTLRNTR